MTITTAFKDELRAKIKCSDVVGRSIALKPNGREYKACCPFHDEKTPSFYVNDAKQFYHCFGCGAHGDIISFLIDHDGMNFMDAIKELADMAGMEMPARDPKAQQRQDYAEKLYSLNEAVSEHYHERLLAHEGAMSYAKGRGITVETMAHFRLGYARWTNESELAARWSAHKQLEQLGLIRERDKGGRYDFFRKRLLIPIHSSRGKVIGFGGRIVEKGEPKYLNSPDTPVFDKGKTLFNHHRAAKPARKANRLIVVEGYMDVIALHEVGIYEVVAPNGTAVTEHQLLLMWQLVDVPIFMLDGDKAGKAAAVRAAMRALPLLQPGKSLKFVFPADGADPDDIARERGLEGINAALALNYTLLYIIWEDLKGKFDLRSPDGNAKLRAEARNIVKSIKNGDVKAAYGQEFAKLLGNRVKPEQRKHQKPQHSPAFAMKLALLWACYRRPKVFFDHYEWILKLADQVNDTLDELIEGTIEIISDSNEEPSGLVAALKRQGFEGHLMALQRQVTLKITITSDEQLVGMLRSFFTENARQ